jgi:hypothetical protein
LPADAAQRDLGKLRGGEQIVFHLADRAIGIYDSEIEDRAYFDGDVVPGDNVLRRHVHRHGAQIDAEHFFDERDHVRYARPARRYHAPQTKDDGALVFLENLDAGDDDERGDDEDCSRESEQLSDEV